MTVIKQYNNITEQWEVIVVGKQGPAGPSEPLGPVGFANVAGVYDSGEGASIVLIDDATILNTKMLIVDAEETYETDPVIVQIEYGLGSLGDRFEMTLSSGSSMTIGFYINAVPDPAEATNIVGPVGYLPTVPPACVVSLTKIIEAQEIEVLGEPAVIDAWLVAAGQLELDV